MIHPASLPALIALLALAAPAAEVKLGYFGPADAGHAAGGTVWQGTLLAVEEANAEGGLDGALFRLVAGWDENPWTGGASIVVRMAYEERVRALIASINGDGTHLAEQVVAKALLPMVDPASTDRTVNAAFVPWAFSVMPDDRTLMGALARRLPPGKFVLLSSTGHDSRMMTGEFLLALNALRRRPERHFQFGRTAGAAAGAAQLDVATAVLLAGIRETAAVLRELRAARPGLAVLAGPAAGRTAFLESAGAAAEGVVFPWPAVETERWRGFAARFGARWGKPPDFAAGYAYDAANLVVTAIRRAGLDRTAIRDALLALAPCEGVSGPIAWDEIRRNRRPVSIGVIRGGRVVLE